MTLNEAIARLVEAGIVSAEYDARELFRAYGATDAYGRISRTEEVCSPELEAAIMRRADREPLQYIIGSVGFYREEYKVTPDVLIPRADTEHLVDYAVKHIPRGEKFIDLCTGSGCVAISTLKNTSDTTAMAVDISAAALAVAEENSRINGVSDRLTLIEADVLGGIDTGEEKYYAVLSNPPYVTEGAYAALEPEIYREPRCAFVGGEDGGDFYRAIVPTAKKIIKPEGFIALEIGYDQKELLLGIADAEDMELEIIKDYSGNDRVAILRFKND